MFTRHPNPVLNSAFASQPYQGVAPETARFLFVGLDANYAADIEHSAIFPQLLKYHEDGPAFWRTHAVHHPFLLSGYTGDGHRYHRTFAKIGFDVGHADCVSFIELLHVPTVGRSTLVPADLNPAYLQRIRHAMFAGAAQLIFVSSGVQRLLLASGSFPELAAVKREFNGLRVLHDGETRAVFLHLHFSNYGKFEQQLQTERKAIAGLLQLGDA